MPKLYLKIGLVLLSMVMVCVPLRSVLAWQSTEQPASTEQSSANKIVMLNNRQTFEGQVDLKDGKYSIGMPSGSRILLPEDRVMFVCDNLRAAYWELAARTRPTDVAGQISVFKWCVGNKLFDEAANHLLILQEMDIPAKTMLKLDVNLQFAQSQHERNQAALAAADKVAQEKQAVAAKPIPKPAPKKIIAGLQPVDAIKIPDLHLNADRVARRLPRGNLAGTENKTLAPTTPGVTIDQFGNEVDGNVRRVSWDQPAVAQGDAVNNSRAPSVSPTVDDQVKRRLKSVEMLTYANLDRLAFSMPKGSVGLFRKQVEPLLQKSCAQCHQNQRGVDCNFKIHQSLTGSIDRRMSQKNLYQSLILSQHDRPEKSPLLTYATTAHGNQKTPSYNFSDPALEPLKRWLIKISDNPSMRVNELRSGESPVINLPQHELPKNESPENESANSRAPFTHRQQSSSNSGLRNSQPSSPPLVSPAKAATPQKVFDEFDADIFNQKFR